MDEVPDRPPFMLMIDSYFTVYQGRRRAIVTGEAPTGPARRPAAPGTHLAGLPEPDERGTRLGAGRTLPPAHGGEGTPEHPSPPPRHREDHSRLARVLKVLDLPEAVLAALREHAGDVRVRAHFTEKRLRQFVAKKRTAKAILGEVQEVLQSHR
ncbi:MAG: hypothetical protein ACE5HD_09940 [Acidobacteriota bacterium]